MSEERPTEQQFDEIRAWRRARGIPMRDMPKTKEQAVAEITKWRSEAGHSEYRILNRRKRTNPEKAYAAEQTAYAISNLARLREEFLAREAERRRG